MALLHAQTLHIPSPPSLPPQCAGLVGGSLLLMQRSAAMLKAGVPFPGGVAGGDWWQPGRTGCWLLCPQHGTSNVTFTKFAAIPFGV